MSGYNDVCLQGQTLPWPSKRLVIHNPSSSHTPHQFIKVHREEYNGDQSSSNDGDSGHLKSVCHSKVDQSSCASCGGSHSRSRCRFKNVICRICAKRRHSLGFAEPLNNLTPHSCHQLKERSHRHSPAQRDSTTSQSPLVAVKPLLPTAGSQLHRSRPAGNYQTQPTPQRCKCFMASSTASNHFYATRCWLPGHHTTSTGRKPPFKERPKCSRLSSAMAHLARDRSATTQAISAKGGPEGWQMEVPAPRKPLTLTMDSDQPSHNGH